jgi:hypothetical protein
MRDRLYLVSICVKELEEEYICHFKGSYKGNKITQVNISKIEIQLKVSEEYVFLLELIKVENDVIYAKTIRYKKICEIKRIF